MILTAQKITYLVAPRSRGTHVDEGSQPTNETHHAKPKTIIRRSSALTLIDDAYDDWGVLPSSQCANLTSRCAKPCQGRGCERFDSGRETAGGFAIFDEEYSEGVGIPRLSYPPSSCNDDLARAPLR